MDEPLDLVPRLLSLDPGDSLTCHAAELAEVMADLKTRGLVVWLTGDAALCSEDEPLRIECLSRSVLSASRFRLDSTWKEPMSEQELTPVKALDGAARRPGRQPQRSRSQ